MNFGTSASDFIILGRLAWKTVQNSRKACGEHDELTLEVSALHAVLQRVKREISEKDQQGAPVGDGYAAELSKIADDCRAVLKTLDKMLQKYNALSESGRSVKKVVQQVRFGNGEMQQLGEIRSKIKIYTSVITLYVNLETSAGVGRVEREMGAYGPMLKDIQLTIHTITARQISRGRNESSYLTDYADDDRAVWRSLRRDLIKDGFSSADIASHKELIKAYVRELGNRGIFDDYSYPESYSSDVGGILRQLSEVEDGLEHGEPSKTDSTNDKEQRLETSSESDAEPNHSVDALEKVASPETTISTEQTKPEAQGATNDKSPETPVSDESTSEDGVSQPSSVHQESQKKPKVAKSHPSQAETTPQHEKFVVDQSQDRESAPPISKPKASHPKKKKYDNNDARTEKVTPSGRQPIDRQPPLKQKMDPSPSEKADRTGRRDDSTADEDGSDIDVDEALRTIKGYKGMADDLGCCKGCLFRSAKCGLGCCGVICGKVVEEKKEERGCLCKCMVATALPIVVMGACMTLCCCAMCDDDL